MGSQSLSTHLLFSFLFFSFLFVSFPCYILTGYLGFLLAKVFFLLSFKMADDIEDRDPKSVCTYICSQWLSKMLFFSFLLLSFLFLRLDNFLMEKASQPIAFLYFCFKMAEKLEDRSLKEYMYYII